jgi:hypothetical protein
MKRFLWLVARTSLWLVLSYELGIVLYRYIDTHVLECPSWIERIVRFGLDIFGYSEVEDPDTIGAFCGLFALVLCWLFVAIALFLSYRLITRTLRRR